MEPLDVDGPDILISAVMISDVGRDICVEPDQLQGCGIQGSGGAVGLRCG